MTSRNALPASEPVTEQPKRRGRPPKDSGRSAGESREVLIRSGLEMLTEKGYSAAGLEEILRHAGVPKGSFYHYFRSKEDFGQTLIDAYAGYFAAKLDRWLLNQERAPLQRLQDFVQDAEQGMARFGFRRGCLVGNLGQEMGALPESFRQQLTAVFEDWQQRTERCLREAQQQRQISAGADCAQLAEFFWIGWEGAVLRAKLEQSTRPMTTFATGFFRLLAVNEKEISA